MAGQFAEEGWEGRQFICDVRKKEEVARAVDGVVEAYGRIDILVNNAGVARGGLVEVLDEQVWDLNQEVNLKGTFLMCQAVIPVMKRQESGRIINAASFAAIIPTIGGAAYPPPPKPRSPRSPECWQVSSVRTISPSTAMLRG